MTERAGSKADRWRDQAVAGPGWRCDWALHRLIRSRHPQSARALGEVVIRAADRTVREKAATAIARLTEQPAIDEVCELAIRANDRRLNEALIDAGHLPSGPARRALWLLLNGQPGHYAGLDLDGDPSEVDSVFELAISSDDARLQAVLDATGRLPSHPARRALWLLLTGQSDRYAELDFDGSLLREVYADADPDLRRRIAERARVAGRIDWVRFTAGDPRTEHGHRLDDEQWEATVRVLADGRRFDQLWRLLPQAPLRWAARTLLELDSGGWRPPEEPDRAAFEILLVRARSCRKPLSARSLFEDPITSWNGPILAVDPQGELMVTTRWNSQKIAGLVIRRVTAGERVSDFAEDHCRECHGFEPRVKFSSDGSLLASRPTFRRALWLWRVPDPTSARLLPVPCCEIEGFALPSNGTAVVSRSCRSRYHAPSVQLWNLADPSDRPVRVVDLTNGERDAKAGPLAVTPDGTMLVTTAHVKIDKYQRDHSWTRLALWHLPSLEPARVLTDSGPRVNGLTFSARGRLLLSSGWGVNTLWHLPSGIPASKPWHGSPGEATVLPDGHLLDQRGRSRRPLDRRLVRELAAGDDGVWPVRAVSPDGTLLVTAGQPAHLAVWHLADAESAGELPGLGRTFHGSYAFYSPRLRFTPAGVLIASESSKIMVWRPRPVLTGAAPVGAVSPPEVHALRTALAECPPSDRAWLELLDALVHLQHRHDIAISPTGPYAGPADTDIEVDR